MTNLPTIANCYRFKYLHAVGGERKLGISQWNGKYFQRRLYIIHSQVVLKLTCFFQRIEAESLLTKHSNLKMYLKFGLRIRLFSMPQNL